MNTAARQRVLEGLHRRDVQSIAAIARRSLRVTVVKKTLPVAAAALLVALAIAPSWRSGPDANRVTYHVQNAQAAGAASKMQGAQYHGMDQQGQPFTLTADSVDDEGSDNMALTQPTGDMTLKSGAWLMLKSDTGLYHQKSQKLDLSGHVTLYRNDGTTMNAPTAQIDLRTGSAGSASPVQVQGPFGTLNAAGGFVLTNRGADVTFVGPATLILTQAQ